jgi:dTDP-4-dehydrorhamnose reductase
MKIFILGAQGFVGTNLIDIFDVNVHEVFALSKDLFELGNISHYYNFDFSNSLIIDCISKIDGAEDEIYKAEFLEQSVEGKKDLYV